jgi:uncharacterized protein YlxP (DUF503 family)
LAVQTQECRRFGDSVLFPAWRLRTGGAAFRGLFPGGASSRILLFCAVLGWPGTERLRILRNPFFRFTGKNHFAIILATKMTEQGAAGMIIGAAEITLYAPWVHSLKEKRMVVKSILDKVRNRFQISAAETGLQDVHQTAVIGVACVAGTVSQADSIIDHVIGFIEENTDAQITNIAREIR